MTKRIPNPAVFTIAIILATVTLAVFISPYFFDYQIKSISAKIDRYAEENKIMLASFETLKTDADFYKDVIKTSRVFESMSGNRYNSEEIMKYSIAIVEESNRYDIDPLLVVAIVATESSFRNNVISHKGAIGMMQLLPSTAKYISAKNSYVKLNNVDELFEPELNLRLGVSYLAYLIKKTGSTEHAIIAYNYGPVNLKRAMNNNKDLPQKYVRKVMKHYNKITASLS